MVIANLEPDPRVIFGLSYVSVSPYLAFYSFNSSTRTSRSSLEVNWNPKPRCDKLLSRDEWRHDRHLSLGLPLFVMELPSFNTNNASKTTHPPQ